MFALTLGYGATVAAQQALRPLRARTTVGAAMMVSTDQAGRLGYERGGLVGELQLSYALLPWFGVQLGASGGAFSAADRTGGLLAPAGGVFARLPGDTLEPYAFVQLGSGYTGTLVRPLLQLGAGLDFALSRNVGIGPTLGYEQLFESNAPRYSTDARFVWAGLSCVFRPFAEPAPAARERVVVRQVTRVEYTPRGEPPEDIAPSPELLELIERAVPSSKTELLAPVLFRFDSDQLEAVGIAMLHEVARELAARPELELIEIQGYADSRGGDGYNVQLSARRAERVRAWLVEHGGVAPQRLRTAPEGASGFVEQGSGENNHQQNRRVVFRVIQTRQP